MNEAGGYYFLISDIAGTVGVLLAAVIIHVTGAYIADTIIALLFAGFMVRNAMKIVQRQRTVTTV